MQFMIMNMVPTREPDAQIVGAADPAWSAYTQAMLDAGVMRSGNALHAGYTATTVRLRDGKRDLHDGPYAESKEELGGYYVIEVADLDEALVWATRNPAAATGAVEVRPILAM